MSKFIDSKNLSITKRTSSILKYSKENDTVGVISIFKNLCLPFNNNKKKELFINIFKESDIPYTWDDKLGFIIFSEKRTLKTVVSHMDLIKKFNTSFSNNKTHEIKDGRIYGALDNTFTNAVLINSILNNRDKNTTYLFTLDEETTQYAIKEYMVRYGTDQFVINLDITNEGNKNNMAIEYDKPCYHICKQINDNMDNPFFTTDRDCDDLDEVMKADGNGFSYCLPTKGNIHSFNNNTSIDKIEPYMEGLEFLIHDLELTEFIPNIFNMSIDKSFKYKNFNEFKENDIVKEKDLSLDMFSDEFIDFLKSSNVNKNKFKKYVLLKLKSPLSFSMNELSHIFPSIDIETLIINNFVFVNNVSTKIKFNEAKILSSNKKNKDLTELILDMTAHFDRGETKHMKKFLKKIENKKDFSEEEFDKYVQGWVLYSLEGYELFKRKSNGGYKINYSFINDKAFKSWKISKKYKSIDSISLFTDMLNKKHIEYSSIISYEKNRNIKIVDSLIDKLLKENLMKSNKENSFKVN